jgi:hypothetical protein
MAPDRAGLSRRGQMPENLTMKGQTERTQAKTVNRISDHILEKALQYQRNEMKWLLQGQMSTMLDGIRQELRNRRKASNARKADSVPAEIFSPSHTGGLQLAQLSA